MSVLNWQLLLNGIEKSKWFHVKTFGLLEIKVKKKKNAGMQKQSRHIFRCLSHMKVFVRILKKLIAQIVWEIIPV